MSPELAIAYTANDWMHKAKEWGARVFEGSRYGGGAGGAAKLKVGNIEGGIKMHDIMGKEFSGGKWVNFYEEKYVIYGEAGKYEWSYSSMGGKFQQSQSLGSVTDALTVELGGTFPMPQTGGAVSYNLELHINLKEIFNFKGGGDE